jgi:hypothetical protein
MHLNCCTNKKAGPKVGFCCCAFAEITSWQRRQPEQQQVRRLRQAWRLRRREPELRERAQQRAQVQEPASAFLCCMQQHRDPEGRRTKLSIS